MEVHPNQTYSTSLEALNVIQRHELLRGTLLLGPALNDLDTQPLRLYQEERNHLGSGQLKEEKLQLVPELEIQLELALLPL